VQPGSLAREDAVQWGKGAAGPGASAEAGAHELKNDMMTRTTIITALVAVLAIIFLSSAGLQAGFSDAADAVNAYIAAHEATGVTAFILFAALSAILSPFTSIPTVPFAVVVWGEELALLFLVIGWCIGGIISYAIGHYGLHAIFQKIFRMKRIEAYRSKFSEHSEFILVVLFRLALPSEVTGLVLGSLRYDFLKYLAATLISEIPFAIVAVYAGGAFVLNSPLQLALWIAGGSAMLILAAAILTKRIGK